LPARAVRSARRDANAAALSALRTGGEAALATGPAGGHRGDLRQTVSTGCAGSSLRALAPALRRTGALLGRLRSVTLSRDGAGRYFAAITADGVPRTEAHPLLQKHGPVESDGSRRVGLQPCGPERKE
jgi:hypothetical protein